MENTALVEAEVILEKAATSIAGIVERAVKAAGAVKFPDKASYLEADAALSEVSRMAKYIDDKRLDLTRPLDKVKAEIKAAADKKITPLLAAKTDLSTALRVYATSEMRWEAEERRKREAEAFKKAEDEKLAEALAAEKSGMPAVADKIMDAPIAPAKVEIATARAEAGSTAIKVWKARVVDVSKFLSTVAATEETQIQNCVVIDQPELNRLAQRTKGLWTVPGIEFYEDVQIRSGR